MAIIMFAIVIDIVVTAGIVVDDVTFIVEY